MHSFFSVCHHWIMRLRCVNNFCVQVQTVFVGFLVQIAALFRWVLWVWVGPVGLWMSEPNNCIFFPKQHRQLCSEWNVVFRTSWKRWVSHRVATVDSKGIQNLQNFHNVLILRRLHQCWQNMFMPQVAASSPIAGLMAKPTMSPEEQLEDLQRRFQLLEGETWIQKKITMKFWKKTREETVVSGKQLGYWHVLSNFESNSSRYAQIAHTTIWLEV